MVQAVTALAHAFHRRVIAKGVELEAERAWLAHIGCDVQGFLLGGPMLPEKVTRLMDG